MKIWPFSLFTKKPAIQLEILFGKESNEIGAHGTIVATHAASAIQRDVVNFAFVGSSVPKLTADILAYITDQAERKGYEVHFLRSYMFMVTQPPIIKAPSWPRSLGPDTLEAMGRRMGAMPENQAAGPSQAQPVERI